jgi:hypothetical protein
MSYTRRQTAVHEAGHAVASIELGWGVTSVRVRESEKVPGAWSGECVPGGTHTAVRAYRYIAVEDRFVRRTEKELRRSHSIRHDSILATICAAGYAAERHYFGEDHYSLGHLQDDRDIQEIAQRRRRTEQAQFDYECAAYDRAEKLFTMTRCQRALVALADALMEREEIPGEEAEEIIRSAMAQPGRRAA